ncbi:MAG: hypothetical protein IIC61_03935 [Proteobacteria bacterium]|nr:hypothetical protein [Pseudomonadota bacterium]
MQRRPGQKAAGDKLLSPCLPQAVRGMVEMFGGLGEIAFPFLLRRG